MKIALLGYGKMGKTIEQIAIQRGHQIILTVDKDDDDYDITKADVAIDFSIPTVAFNNISNCIEHSGYENWKLDSNENKIIPITAKRIEDVPGTHTVTYKSDVDTITIEHQAHNRQGFALGAVIAAEWIVGKKGVFTMNDVLNIG